MIVAHYGFRVFTLSVPSPGENTLWQLPDNTSERTCCFQAASVLGRHRFSKHTQGNWRQLLGKAEMKVKS